MGKRQFKVKPYTNPSGNEVYQVTGTKINGERVRRNFKDAADAELFRQKLENEALGLTPQFHVHQTCLTEHQLRQAEAVYRTDPAVDLEAAVKFYVAHHPAGRACPTVKQFVDEYLEDCRARRLRVRTVTDYRNRAQRLVEVIGDRPLNTVTSRELTKIIRQRGGSHYTQNGLRRVFSTLFSQAVKQDYLVNNPIEKIDAIKGEPPEPMILQLDGVKRLLAASMRCQAGATLPRLAVALFCGSRPSECARLRQSAFDWNCNTLRISAEVAKKRSKRLIQLSDTAIGWLHPLRSSKLNWSRWDDDFREVRRLAGFVYNLKSEEQQNNTSLHPWCPDILRHTAISYWLAKHKDIGAASAWAGNTPDVIHEHYRGLVSEADAEAYWSLTPESVTAWAEANQISVTEDQ